MDFNACELEYLEKTFGLMPSVRLPALSEWLDTAMELNDGEQYEADALREQLELNVLHWNEQELSLHCIGPIFSIPKFTIIRKMNLFAQRFITADVPDSQGGFVTLSGRPDGILASGFRSPDKPFFSFQEYKKEKDPNGDPGGQCLAAMLVGQAKNDDLSQPVYGCYVVGQNWQFMVLIGKQYAISPAFSAQTDEIYFIIGVLKRLKELVAARVGA